MEHYSAEPDRDVLSSQSFLNMVLESQI